MVTFKSVLQQSQELMRDACEMFRRNAMPAVLLSPGVLPRLTSSSRVASSWRVEKFNSGFTLCGLDIMESNEQLMSRTLVSCDPFTEYAVADADWAVPLGLAKWVSVNVDAMLIDLSRHMMRLERRFLEGDAYYGSRMTPSGLFSTDRT